MSESKFILRHVNQWKEIHYFRRFDGLTKWHFWSYYPGMKPLHVVVERNDYTAKIKSALADFVALYKREMDAAIPRLKENVEISHDREPQKGRAVSVRCGRWLGQSDS